MTIVLPTLMKWNYVTIIQLFPRKIRRVQTVRLLLGGSRSKKWTNQWTLLLANELDLTSLSESFVRGQHSMASDIFGRRDVLSEGKYSIMQRSR